MNTTSAIIKQPHERRLLVIGLMIITVTGALTVGVGAAGDPPPLPAAYYGDVTANDEPIPDGYTIEAEIDGEVRGIITTKDGKYGSSEPTGSKLLVNGTADEDGERNIIFYVANEAGDRVRADETISWQSGAVQRFDLSVENGFPEQDSNTDDDNDGSTGGIGGGGPAPPSDSSEETPESTEETPEAAEETPESTEETPEAAEETPEAAEETPGSTAESPEAAEETADKTDGSIPGFGVTLTLLAFISVLISGHIRQD